MAEPGVKSSLSNLSRLWGLLFIAGAVFIAFILAYYLGHSILTDPSQPDIRGRHFARVEWLNQYFPSIPQWYPREGGGVSLLQGYPLFAYLVVLCINSLSNLSLYQSYRLIIFLSLPLTAIGVFFFGWVASRKRTVGLLAAIFYLLTPASWAVLFEDGSFSQTVGLIFIPFGLTCLIGYLRHHLARSQHGSRRLWLVGLILSLAGAILTDLRVGAALVLLTPLFVIMASISQKRGQQVTNLLRAIWGTAIVGLFLVLVLAFYLVPHYEYEHVSNREGALVATPAQLSLPAVSQFLGFESLAEGEETLVVQFPLAVTISLVIATILSFINHHEFRAFFLITLLAFACILIPQLDLLRFHASPLFQMLLNTRSWFFALTILAPVGAAIGAVAFARTVLNPRSLIQRNASLSTASDPSAQPLNGALVSLLAFLLAGGLIATTPVYQGFNAFLGSDIGRGYGWELVKLKWPNFSINDVAYVDAKTDVLVSILPEKAPLRIDVSPHLENLADELLMVSDASQICVSPAELSLIQSGWEYQKKVFFSRDLGVNELGNLRSLNNTAQWFGTDYVILDPEMDRPDIYEAAGWEPVFGDEDVHLWRYPDSLAMASLTSRPSILVTERPGRKSYMTFFRLANDGLLPYEEALLVEGRERIDNYSIEDLRPFDVILLVGYDYRNRSKAFETIGAYVEQGGSLFVDTGWQYVVAEWEFEQAPSVLPINRLTWTDYGMTEEYELGMDEIVGAVDVGQFKPLVWEGNPWALSGAEHADIRDWGRVVLSANGNPLIVAGEYGQGRVVWSGMNLINHAIYRGENDEEILLLHNLLDWLLRGKDGVEVAPTTIKRDHPDRVTLSLEPFPGEVNWLYWREAYHPSWHAYVTDGTMQWEVPIHRAGPGFMVCPIQTTSDDVTLTLAWERPFVAKIAGYTSVFGVILIVALVFDGLLLNGNGFTWVKIAMTMWLPKPILDEEVHTENNKRGPSTTKEGEKLGRSGHSLEKRAVASISEGVGADDQLSDEHLDLLKSWMESTGHTDDRWASKILGKRNHG